VGLPIGEVGFCVVEVALIFFLEGLVLGVTLRLGLFSPWHGVKNLLFSCKGPGVAVFKGACGQACKEIFVVLLDSGAAPGAISAL
jgi:hypothetical protein